MAVSPVAEVQRAADRLLSAADILLAFCAPATEGPWWADQEVVHASAWHPSGRGSVCWPLVTQNGRDPEADAEWAALMDPRIGPKIARLLRAIATQSQALGHLELDVFPEALLLADFIINHATEITTA